MLGKSDHLVIRLSSMVMHSSFYHENQLQMQATEGVVRSAAQAKTDRLVAVRRPRFIRSKR